MPIQHKFNRDSLGLLAINIRAWHGLPTKTVRWVECISSLDLEANQALCPVAKYAVYKVLEGLRGWRGTDAQALRTELKRRLNANSNRFIQAQA